MSDDNIDNKSLLLTAIDATSPSAIRLAMSALRCGLLKRVGFSEGAEDWL